MSDTSINRGFRLTGAGLSTGYCNPTEDCPAVSISIIQRNRGYKRKVRRYMNLHGLVSIVQESRDLTALVFPLPDVDGCVDYAITEAGEYLDAILRAKRTGDKRNNVKDSDERKEWGQCGYMIASAMIQIDDCDFETEEDPLGGDIYTLLELLCGFRKYPNEAGWQLADALRIWEMLCTANEWDAAELMAETCNAFEYKHLPELFE